MICLDTLYYPLIASCRIIVIYIKRTIEILIGNLADDVDNAFIGMNLQTAVIA